MSEDKTLDHGQLVQVDERPGVAVMQIIATASANPDTDIDKMKSLIEMKKDMDQYDANKAYWKQMARMQPKLPIVEKLGPGHNSKYARFEDVIVAIRPVLTKFGFSLTFKHRTEDGLIVTVGRLAHKDGHIEEDEFVIPPDLSGNKSAIHGVGSSRSYGKRYTTGSLLGLAFCDEDDDGAASGRDIGAELHATLCPETESMLTRTMNGKPCTGAQAKLLRAKCENKGITEEQVCKTMKLDGKHLVDIPMSRVNEALDLISAQ